MSDHIRAGDHAMGLELQIEDLVEQSRRAAAQGRHSDAVRINGEIAELQNELASTAEMAADAPEVEAGPIIHGATQLDMSDYGALE